MHPSTKSLGEPRDRIHGDINLTAFHFAEILGIEIGFLGQLLLTEAGLLAAGADGATQNPAMLRKRHVAQPKQEGKEARTRHIWNLLLHREHGHGSLSVTRWPSSKNL